ncbi:hypothetical protein JW905_12570 [bacterium]|nr:hypothetical protein [candidate division CSSED10-310 bacterium]
MEETSLVLKIEEMLQELRRVSQEIAALRRALPSALPPDDSGYQRRGFRRPGDRRPPQGRYRSVPDVMHGILADYGITVLRHKTESIPDSKKDGLALLIGSSMKDITPWYQNFLEQVKEADELYLEVDEEDETVRTAWEKIFNKLQSWRGLDSWFYDEAQQVFTGDFTPHPEMYQFFLDGWFPRYIARLIQNAIRAQNRQMTYLYEPELKLESGDVVTVDLALLIDSEFHWAACVTDYYSADLDSLSVLASKLGTPIEQSHMFVLGLEDELAEQLSEEFNLRVSSQDRVLESFEIFDLPVSRLVSTKIFHEFPTNLRAFLNQHNLRPFPERRKHVLANLLRLSQTLPTPLPLTNYKRILHQHLGVSKTCIQDILNAVVRSGSVIDLDGNQLYSFNLPVSSFSTDSIEELDSRCRQSYCYVILKYHPSYFDMDSNRNDFIETVGLAPPAEEEIQRILEMIQTAQESEE